VLLQPFEPHEFGWTPPAEDIRACASASAANLSPIRDATSGEIAVDPGPTSAEPVLWTGAFATSGAAAAEAAYTGTDAMPDIAAKVAPTANLFNALLIVSLRCSHRIRLRT
jgi:hypothetical protein